MNNKNFQSNKVDSSKPLNKSADGNKVERVGEKIARDDKSHNGQTGYQAGRRDEQQPTKRS